MPETNCRYFTGYKPCHRSSHCDETCSQKDVPLFRILLVHLGALGAVVRATSLLKAIKRKYPSSHITWVTDSPAHKLLTNHPFIDRVLQTDVNGMLSLANLHFDVAFCIDKSLKASGVLHQTKIDKLYGYFSNSDGVILPASEAARELWEIGLDDERKFFINQKSEVQLMIEALELGPYQLDEYFLPLTTEEQQEVKCRAKRWSQGKIVVGLNTGCSSTIEYKKLTVKQHRILAQRLLEKGYRVVLLGGPEDTLRNREIARDLDVINTETESGLRDGYMSVHACDIVVTGDSLGMHLSIAAKKWIVAWFGPTCSHEIELYKRGVKIQTKAACSPCWKRSCQNFPMCYDLVSLDEVIAAVDQGALCLEKTYSYKQPLLETCY